MKTPTLPAICGFALAAMSTAGLSHWWSVREFVAAIDIGLPVGQQLRPADAPAATPVKSPQAPNLLLAKKSPAAPAPAAVPAQRDFYEKLITKMDDLQTQNRDLLDQLAETNRDVMKLEFRVDTHSESFRPLPVGEDRPLTTNMVDGPGVLPPRAEPVMLPTFE